MRRSRQTGMGLRSYRNHRLEVADDGAEGWVVAIHAPGGGPDRVALRNRVPNGLAALLEEARTQIDRRLDGGAWPREP